MVKNPQRLAATDVVPGKLYLARLSVYERKWHLVTVQCKSEPGWLRGYVNVRNFFTRRGVYHAWATVAPVIEGPNFDLPVERRSFKQPWMFVDYDKALLTEVPDDYVMSRLNELRLHVNKHHAECKRLESKIAQLEALA